MAGGGRRQRNLLAIPKEARVQQCILGKQVNAPDYEAWRPALIAFCERECPWASMTLENLRLGRPLSDDNRRTIEALILAAEQSPERLAA